MTSWVGNTISAGVDTYFRARDMANREEEQQQIAQLRAMQAERMRRDLADQELSRAGAEELAEDSAPSTVTLAAGTPDTLPTYQEEITGPAPELGGFGPDASLGNLPSKVTATPGRPGEPPVTMHGMTEPDAIRKLGAKKYAAMMRTPEGREALKQAGLITNADLAVRQKTAQSKREFTKTIKEANQLTLDGDPVAGLYKEAAALERLSETSDDREWQRYYSDESRKKRDQATSLAQNKAEEKLAREDGQAQMAAAIEMAKNPGPKAYLDYMETMRGAKSAIGQQKGLEMMTRMLSKPAEKFFADPQMFGFMSAVSQDMVESHTMDMEGSMKRVLSSMDPASAAAVIPKLMTKLDKSGNVTVTDDPRILRLFGFDSVTIKDAWTAATAMAAARGLKSGSPAYADFVMSEVKKYDQAKKTGEGKAEYLKELLASERTLAKEYQDQAKNLKGFMPNDVRQELMVEHERSRIALRGIREQIGNISDGKINMLGDPRAQYDAAAQRNMQKAKANAGLKEGDDIKDPRNAEKIRKFNREYKRLMEDEGLDPMNPPAVATPTK